MSKPKARTADPFGKAVKSAKRWAGEHQNYLQATAIVIVIFILGFVYWQYSQSAQQANAIQSQAQLSLNQAQALDNQIANATKAYQQAAMDEAQAQAALSEMQTLLKQAINNTNVSNQTKAALTQLLKPPAVSMTLSPNTSFSGFKAVGISQPLVTDFNVTFVNTGFRPVILGKVQNNLACAYNVSGKIKVSNFSVGQVRFFASGNGTLVNPDFLPLNGTLKELIPVVIAPKQVANTSNRCWLNLTTIDNSNNVLGSLILPTKVLTGH